MNKKILSFIFCFYLSCSGTNQNKGEDILFQELITNSGLLQSGDCVVTPAKDSYLSSFATIQVKCPRGYGIKEEALTEDSIRYTALNSEDKNAVSDFYWERISQEEVHLKSRSSVVSGKIGFHLSAITGRDGSLLPSLDYSVQVDQYAPVADLKFPSGSYDETIFLSNVYDITFSEPVTGATDLSNYKLNFSEGGSITIRNIAKLNELSYRIFWQGTYPRQGGSLSLTLQGIKDNAGNAISQVVNYQILGWKDGPNILSPRGDFGSAVLSDGQVLIFGGLAGSVAFKSVEGYRESEGFFSAKNDLTVTRRLFSKAVTSLNEIVIAGGYTTNLSASITNTTDIYNPNTGTWSAGPNLNSARISHASCSLPDGRVMVSGGRNGISGVAMDNVGIITLNHSGGGTIANYTMLVARYWHTCVSLPNGKVWIAGYGKQTEYFDPATNTFSFGPDLVAPQDSMATIQDKDGNVYLISGKSGLKTDIVQKFDWRTEQVTIISYLPRAMINHVAASLPDDSFLVVGGTPDVTESSYVYKVWKSGFIDVPEISSLKQNRISHDVIKLPSGKLMVLGGRSGSGTVDLLSNTEIFGP